MTGYKQPVSEMAALRSGVTNTTTITKGTENATTAEPCATSEFIAAAPRLWGSINRQNINCGIISVFSTILKKHLTVNFLHPRRHNASSSFGKKK